VKLGVDWVWIRGRAIRGRGVVGIWFERGLVGVVCHRPPKYDSPVWLSNRDALRGGTQPRASPPTLSSSPQSIREIINASCASCRANRVASNAFAPIDH
jgi:hypothetical protein